MLAVGAVLRRLLPPRGLAAIELEDRRVLLKLNFSLPST